MDMWDVIAEYFVIILILMVSITFVHDFDMRMEELEDFTCGEALGRHHGAYAPDDWIDEVMWNECVLGGIKTWPKNYKDHFSHEGRMRSEIKYMKAKIKVLIRKIEQKGK